MYHIARDILLIMKILLCQHSPAVLSSQTTLWAAAARVQVHFLCFSSFNIITTMYYYPSVFPRHDMLYEASGVISNQSGRDYDVASSPYLSILAHTCWLLFTYRLIFRWSFQSPSRPFPWCDHLVSTCHQSQTYYMFYYSSMYSSMMNRTSVQNNAHGSGVLKKHMHSK